jgi:hypothetical protein
MGFFILKAVISGLIVAIVSAIGKKYPVAGGVLAALPLISILSLSFLYFETKGNTEQIGRLSTSIGWFVLSAGVFLMLLPVLLKRQIAFVKAMLICTLVLLVIDALIILAQKRFDS